MAKTSQRSWEAAAEACVDVLHEDRPRLKRLLREAAALLDEISELLGDARRPADAKYVHRIAKVVRGTALLPTALATAGLKLAISKLFAGSR